MADDVVESFASPGGEARAGLKHPIAAFFHMVFRVTAILVYILAPTILGGDTYFVHIFLAVVLLLAVDFWTVKNVTGRLMVGLRWWNRVDEDGTSTWMFEAKKKSTTSHPESLLFWGGLVLCPLLWIFFFFTAIIKFSGEWALIPVMGIALQGANVVGYVKCRRDAGAKITQMAGQFIGKQILKQSVEQAWKGQGTT